MKSRLLLTLLCAQSAFLNPGCSNESGGDVTPPPDGSIGIHVDTSILAATVDERYLSFAVDTLQVVRGEEHLDTWEGETQPPPVPYSFDRPRLRRMSRELTPAILRIGGTAADMTYYNLDPEAQPLETPPAPYEETMTLGQVESVFSFAVDLGMDVSFCLNIGPGPRRADDSWDPANARGLLELVRDREWPITMWEAGNEPNGFALNHNGFQRTPQQLSDDFRDVRALIEDVTPGVLLGGPSTSYWPIVGEMLELYPQFMTAGGGEFVDAVIWHYYPMQSFRCPISSLRAQPDTLLDPDNLNEINFWTDQIEEYRDRFAPEKPIWLGETGNAQCGGEPEVSDAFAGTLWWTDQLGLLAQRGHQVVVRQVLSGFSYGVIDDRTLEPNPDYFASVLWKRLMGTRVLATDSPNRLVRAYAHCAPGETGAVSVLLIHLDQIQSRTVALEGFRSKKAELRLLTAESLNARAMKLNGEELAVDSSGAPPEMFGQPMVLSDTAWLEMPPLSIAFVHLPDAGIDACR